MVAWVVGRGGCGGGGGGGVGEWGWFCGGVSRGGGGCRGGGLCSGGGGSGTRQRSSGWYSSHRASDRASDLLDSILPFLDS